MSRDRPRRMGPGRSRDAHGQRAVLDVLGAAPLGVTFVRIPLGRGFCTQYNGALAIILRELGLQAWLVYAPRVRFDDQPDWALGHTWVRVRVDGDVRDVCARSLANSAGRVHFEPARSSAEAEQDHSWLTTTGSYGMAVAAIALARLHGRPRPEWVERSR